MAPTPPWIGLAAALIGLAGLAGVALWLVPAPAVEAPPVRILAPAPGAVAPPTPTLVFETNAPLRLGPRGWMAGELHLHAAVGERELMPGAADVRDLGDGRFEWTLPALPAGAHRVRLYWSDLGHRPVGDATGPRLLRVGPDPEAEGPP